MILVLIDVFLLVDLLMFVDLLIDLLAQTGSLDSWAFAYLPAELVGALGTIRDGLDLLGRSASSGLIGFGWVGMFRNVRVQQSNLL